jgi:phage tail-like protein
MLLIFERILTGTPDGISIRHGTHLDYNFEKTINELTQMYNPLKTKKDFLPWLASWVALTLPEDLSEYQKRKIISNIVSIYQKQGLKEGLHAYLDIYVTEAKPRIAIDDGDAILRATFLDNGTATLYTVAHSSEVSLKERITNVLLHPAAIAADINNNYIVVDKSEKPVLWKVSSTGEIIFEVGDKSSPKIPIPVPKPFYSGNPLNNPTAVVVDSHNRYSVVDIGTTIDETSINSAIYRFGQPINNPSINTIIDQSSNPPLPAVHPVDMILDKSENFVVLDRGIHPPEGHTKPQIIVVSEVPPMEATPHLLTKVVEPTALTMDSNGRFIVADSKDQFDYTPADLIIVDPKTGWSETSLLDGVLPNENPLIYPTGLAFENLHSLYVCDVGIRWGYDDDEANRKMAEPAAIYRIDLLQTPPAISRVTYERKLVYPTKMILDRKGKLIVTDQGDYIQTVPPKEWRAKANEFGVSVLFSQQRPTSPEDRNKTRQKIRNIVDEQKPANTYWWMKP